METEIPTTALETHIGYWLRFVSNTISSAFARKLEVHGVSMAEWVVLRLIHGDADMTASELADAIGMTRGAISKIIDRLEARELLARRISPADGRSHILKLTTGGTRLVPLLATLADRNDAEFFNHLSARDRRSLMQILKSIVARNELKGIPID